MTQGNRIPLVRIGATAEDEFKPDTAIFTIRFSGKCKTQQECAEQFAAEADAMRTALEPFGLESELKTSGYSTYQCRTRRKGLPDGFEYWCNGTLKLKCSDYDAGAVWMALSGSVADIPVNLRFELDDVRSAEDSLIAQAVTKARSGAEALAHATGMELGGVAEIRYQSDAPCSSWMYELDAMPAPSGGPSEGESDPFDPKPIEVSCRVDIDWQLVKP